MNKFATTLVLAAILTGCGTAPVTRPQVAAGPVSTKYDPAVAAAKTEIKRALEADKGTKVETLSVSPTPLGTVFTFRATLAEGGDRFEVSGTYNVVDGDVKVTKKQAVTANSIMADPEVAAAKTEIRRALEADKGTKVETLSVSPTPLGTVFTFRATLAEGGDRFEVSGTYNVLDGNVKVAKKQAVTAKK